MKLISALLICTLSALAMAQDEMASAASIPDVNSARLGVALAKGLKVHSVSVLQVQESSLDIIGNLIGSSVKAYNVSLRIKPSLFSARIDFAQCILTDDASEPTVELSDCQSQTTTVPNLTLNKSDLQ